MIGDVLAPTHLLLILLVALLVLGPKRLPEVGRSLGKGLRDFRDAMSNYSPDALLNADDSPPAAPAAPAAPAPTAATATATPAPPAANPATAEPDVAAPAAPAATATPTAAPEPADAEVVPDSAPTVARAGGVPAADAQQATHE